MEATAQRSKEEFLSKMYLFQKYSAVLVLTSYQILGTTGSVQSQKKKTEKGWVCFQRKGLISSA